METTRGGFVGFVDLLGTYAGIKIVNNVNNVNKRGHGPIPEDTNVLWRHREPLWTPKNHGNISQYARDRKAALTRGEH